MMHSGSQLFQSLSNKLLNECQWYKLIFPLPYIFINMKKTIFKILITIAKGHGIILIFQTNHHIKWCNFSFHTQFYCPAFLCKGSTTYLPLNLTIPTIHLSPLPPLPPLPLFLSLYFCIHSSIHLCLLFYVNIQILLCMYVLVSTLLSHVICVLKVFRLGCSVLSAASPPDSSSQPLNPHTF